MSSDSLCSFHCSQFWWTWLKTSHLEVWEPDAGVSFGGNAVAAECQAASTVLPTLLLHFQWTEMWPYSSTVVRRQFSHSSFSVPWGAETDTCPALSQDVEQKRAHPRELSSEIGATLEHSDVFVCFRLIKGSALHYHKRHQTFATYLVQKLGDGFVSDTTSLQQSCSSYQLERILSVTKVPSVQPEMFCSLSVLQSTVNVS